MIYLKRLDVKSDDACITVVSRSGLKPMCYVGTRKGSDGGTMEIEQTLVLIKPDGVQRGLIGEVIARYERKGLKVVGIKLQQLPREAVEALYAVHHGRSFYDVLIEFMTSAPIVALVVEGRGAIELVRIINGDTDPMKSQPGTIRGDLSVNVTHNIVHASDSAESAKRELDIVFEPEECYTYNRVDEVILHPAVRY